MLSLIIPVFNEENLIDELIRRSVASVESITNDYEIIFVDDGSTDSSFKKVLFWRERNRQIKLLSLSRNFGHQAAYTAGLENAKGEIVAMMDGDLQDPPELLPAMYGKLVNEDYDIICGRKKGRMGKKGRNLYSRFFHYILRQIGDLRNIENYGNFSIMKRDAVNALLMMREKIRYIPGLRAFIGFRQGHIDFIRDERFRGDPKMTLKKLFMLATDAIFSFSKFPIHFCLILGTLGTVTFMGAGIYVLIAKISGFAISGWSSTLLSIYFLGSIQLVFLGILGEYIYRDYKESQNRPLYIVRKFYDDSFAN
jgi:polyisoprenyl-phosphate glycosyltransferase